MQNKHIFISKSLDHLPLLKQWSINKECIIIDESFLSFEVVPFEVHEDFNVVFFSSPRSFDFLTSHFALPKSVNIACAGLSTKTYIERKGFHVDFFSKEAGNVTQSSLAFKHWLPKNAKVLFPISNRSKHSYAKFLDANQCIEKVVYQTHIMEKVIPACSVYIFTSPSNIEGFLKCNSIPFEAKVMVWGETSSKALFDREHTVLKRASEHELIELLDDILP